MKNPFSARFALWLAMALLAALAIGTAGPPSATGSDVASDVFSTERALEHLRVIAASPRPTGSTRNDEVRRYLEGELRAYGLEVAIEREAVDPSWSKRTVPGGVVTNIVARRPGAKGDVGPKSALLLAAHYDSVATGPGASDDGVGVVAILETLRALQNGPPLDSDVIVLFSDGEELGLVGARAFSERSAFADRVAIALNFEARGSRGPAMMFETSTDAGALIDVLAEKAPHPFASSLSYEIYRRMPNDTDFTVFKKRGIQGLNFAFIEGVGDYHMPTDDSMHLDPRSLQHVGESALALTRALATGPVHPFEAKREVYFNLLGSWFVHYGDGAILPIEIGAIALVVVAWLARRRESAPRLRGVAIGAGGYVAGLIGAALIGMAIGKAVSAVTGPRGRIEQLETTLILAIVLTASFAALATRFLTRFASAIEISAGVSLVSTLVMLLGSHFLPGASYLLAFPLVGLALGWLLMARGLGSGPRDPTKTWLAPAIGLVSCPAILLGAPLVKQLHAALGFHLVSATAALVFVVMAWLSPALFVATGALQKQPQ